MFMDDLQKPASFSRPSEGGINWFNSQQELLQAVLQLVLERKKSRNTRSFIPASFYSLRAGKHNQPRAVEGE